jgi:hypothetical protein
MTLRSIAISSASIFVACASASAQSINIRFGAATSTPSATYAAAGQAGVWNTFQVPPAAVRLPLVDLTGAPTSAQFYQIGNASILSYDNPNTSGEDQQLLDSMILSTNSPTDGCFWVEGLTLGAYEVTIYAMTPDNPALLNRTRVDNGSPGPVMVGGAWPGHHQAGVTFARFTVTTYDGVIAFHDGLAGSALQSGMNGVQLEYLPPGGARAINYGVGCLGFAPLTLSASARPVQGTIIDLVTTNIPATTVLSANVLSFTSHDPGIDLSPAMPGCFRYLDLDYVFVMSGAGSTSSMPLGPFPVGASWLGVMIFCQSVSLVPGVNPTGAISSNGTILLIGSV